MLSGRTRQNKLVHFSPEPTGTGGGCPATPGSYAQVKITGAAPHHLRGELSTTQQPRRRRRLQVSAG
jgi:hypothetical protein